MKYKVISSLKYNQVDYVKGDIIEMEQETAKLLLADKILEEINEVKEVKVDDEAIITDEIKKEEGSKKGRNKIN